MTNTLISFDDDMCLSYLFVSYKEYLNNHL